MRLYPMSTCFFCRPDQPPRMSGRMRRVTTPYIVNHRTVLAGGWGMDIVIGPGEELFFPRVGLFSLILVTASVFFASLYNTINQSVIYMRRFFFFFILHLSQ